MRLVHSAAALLLGSLSIVAAAGIRWTNPAGSFYTDIADPPEARGAFAHRGALYTLVVQDGRYAVLSWDTGESKWKPWSVREEAPQPKVVGAFNHVRVVAPGVLKALLDVGPARPGDRAVRLCEWWTIALDENSRTLRWSRGTSETHDLVNISNFADEASAYFAERNSALLGTKGSPAHIDERYVFGSATTRTAVAFAVSRELHVYSLPNRKRGLVRPTHQRRYVLRTNQVTAIPNGWAIIAHLPAGSWSGSAILFVDGKLGPTGLVPLPNKTWSQLEPAGDANIVFDFQGVSREAWQLHGNEVRRLVWSEKMPYGHIAATLDHRWLFLTNGERVAVPVSGDAVTPQKAAGLRVGWLTFVVRPGVQFVASALMIFVAAAIVALAYRRLRKRSAPS